MEKLMNTFKGIGSSLMDALMPLGKILLGVLYPIFVLVKYTLMGIVEIFKGIGWVLDVTIIKPAMQLWNILTEIGSAIKEKLQPSFEAISNPITQLWEKFKGIGAILKEKLQPAFERVSKIGQRLSAVFQPIIDKIKEIGSKISKTFQPLFSMFSSSAGGEFTKILGTIGDILGGTIMIAIEGIVWGVELIVSVFEYMIGFIEIIGAGITKYIVDPVLAAVNTLSSIGSYLGFGDATVETEPPKEHINDGIVQNGRVVTTNPADTILATKSPGSMMGGGNNDVLISKMNELINAVKTNKDVYIDKEKITNTIVKSSEKQTQNLFGLGVA
jgi:phage-related protein